MSKALALTISHSIFIARPRQDVWDFTQDYSKRQSWDSAVLNARVINTESPRKIKLSMRGGTTMTFVYKLDDRPRKTSLATEDVHSSIIHSGGGSWNYEEVHGGTRWTQTNTLLLRDRFFTPFLAPWFRRIFQRQTVMAMKKAKRVLES
jgi:hypothetical protein